MAYLMMRSTRVRPGHCLLRAKVVIAQCLFAASVCVCAAPTPWPDSSYSYFTEAAPLESVLREFASGFSLGLALAPGVTGTVNGRFSSANPTEFLARLGGVYGFLWYTHGGKLHVSRAADAVMRVLPLPPGGTGRLRQILTEMGVVDPRFGWGELPDHGVLMVSGPVSYVDLVESTLKQLPVQSRNASQIAMFRLRHASADDRVIQLRDRQFTQRGLASVLRDLVAGGGTSVGAGLAPERAGVPLGPLASLPLFGGTAPAADDPQPARSAAAGSADDRSAAGARPGPGRERAGGASSGSVPAPAHRVSIQSDPRLNALIITDLPERMGLYERLIAQLDVPSPLIEIEAMIIDVNVERARELGINWSLRAGNVSATFGVPVPPRQGMLSLSVNNSGSGVSSSDASFMAQIRLLESTGDARIQSRPSVLTTDNIGALLDLSETFYIRVQGERVATVSPVTAGTTLRVTPRLVDGVDSTIQLTVDIEDGQIQDRQVDSLPTVRRSSVSTQAVVRQNEALVIAGYSSDQNINGQLKVPLLGDLPWIGGLFSSQSRLVQRRERIFLIRPRLVSDASGAGIVAPVIPPR